MSEVQRLRDRIEELESVLGVGHEDVTAYKRALKLTTEQAKVLGLIAKRGTVTRESIFTVLYGARPDCDQPADVRIVDVIVCHVRKRLHDAVGVELETVWGVGFRMSSAGKSALRAFVAEKAKA
jgi:DNA-binding response OmpR family regulator